MNVKPLDKGIRKEVAKEEEVIVRQDVIGGEKQELELGSEQVLKSKFNYKFYNIRGPYSLTKGKPRGSTARRAPGVRKVKDPGTREIKLFFTKLRTRQEDATGPKTLVSLFEDLQANEEITVIGPKGDDSSGGIYTDGSSSITNGCFYQTGK